MKHNLLKSVILSVILLMGVSNALGKTTATLYYSVPASTVGCYTVKCYYNFGYSQTGLVEMTKVDKTSNGNLIYSVKLTADHDNVDNLLFQLFDGSTWKSEQQVMKDWTPLANKSGQMYVHNTGWKTYSTDAAYTVYFVNKDSWTGTIKAYAWNSDCDKNKDWSGADMTSTGKTYQGKNIYSITLNKRYANIIFNDGSSKTGDLTLGSTNIGKMYDGLNWVDYNVDPVVTFKANGGTGNDYTQTVKYNTSTALTANQFTRTGYSFNGWKTAANSGTSYADNANVTFKANTTLYAQWELATYTITYDNLKGATHTNPATYTINSATITFTAPTSKPTGYTFANWSLASITTGSTGNKTVTANWTATTSTVELNQEEATEKGTASVTATYGSAMPAITKLPIRTGYTFGGYYTGKNGAGTQYYEADGTSATTWNLEGAQTLYAKWTPITYSVKFNGNGSTSGSMSNQSFTYDEAAKALTTNAFKKTGYTFAGWNTAANGSGTSYADKATVRNLTTTNNATINLYAKWTINQYTLTYSAGEGGSVTGTHESGAKYDYNTSIKLTAKPTADNIFIQWVNESGTMVSTANPYTFNLTANKTVKAEFAPPTTVYLKPEGYWPDASARFAIIASAAGKQNKQVNMQSLGCENEYYSANVPVGYTTYKYVRVNPSNTSEIWNETGVYNVQDGKNKLHVATRIYFKPDVNWKSDYARFAVYFYKSSNTSEYLWRDLTAIGDDYYVCNSPGTAYDRAIFCRMNPSNKANEWETKWNQTNDLYIDINSIGGKNLYTITKATGTNMEGDLGTWSTHWETFTTPTYPLTLKATPYGEYTVKCNGVSHTSSRTKDIVIDLPVGATVEITKAESYDAAYNNNLVIKTSSNSQYEAADLNTTYTFCGATTIEENFTTTAAHVVYLRVKTTGDPAAWNTTGANYIYCTNRLTNKVVAMTAVAAGNSEINQETGYNYFKATVPAGYRAFRFERKTASNVAATNTTEYFEHLLPLGQSNCFTIEGKNTSLGTFYGDWALGTADGDYRILYVEQQVAHGTGADDWKTVIDTTYQHASDIIKKGDGATIVSLHIKYDKTKHPEVILQKFTGGKWVDVEGQAHMVLSPLTASADMAMLPGRRNTEGDANLRYGDGIEEIKDDAETGIEGRVWNFTVQQSDASAYIDFTAETFAPYEGNYYIRTDNADGGWMTYAIPGNVMSHSEYSLEHSDYSHYFCKWVASDGTPNVKFVVANDYGAVISDTIASDIYTDENGTLEADANVRWMWNEYTNIGSRAYIAGSKVSNFLVAKYAASSTKTFVDKGEWVYEADLIDVKIDDKLTSIAATYDAQEQELLEKSHFDAGGLVMLASAGNARVSAYTVRIVYDFKINQTICYLIPTENAVATSIDVLIERINQDEAGQATQVTAAITPANKEVGLTVYGLITLTKDHITDPNKSEQEALTYWISFPFDVKIGDITGFGEVGKHWMIKYYDGAERAEKGWFLDTKTFWKFFLDTEDVMKANTGYVLTLNKSLLNESNPVYDNTKILKLYFPSKEKITGEINSGLTKTTVDVPEHLCKITSPANRTIKDSHWNLIGVPSYAHKTNYNKDVKFFYNYDFQKDAYSTEKNEGPNTFYAMHAYMVQYHGTIDWSTFTTAPAQLAAKKNADAEEQYTLRLELQQNGTKADQTFVELHDDATTMFDMNVDLTKMFNASSANIYTLIGSDNQVAANVMPIANTVIPVGVQIAKAGEYTFAMPDGTDGITVELIDYETNTRTNLLLSEYTVNLTAGTCENRFALSVKPNNTATNLDNISGETGDEASMKKFIIDGVLYMQKDGVLYDAQGHVVR